MTLSLEAVSNLNRTLGRSRTHKFLLLSSDMDLISLIDCFSKAPSLVTPSEASG
jgi:hypothetical protein